jgi:hypothetical protein
LTKTTNPVLVVDKIIPIHKFSEIKCLIHFLSLNMGFPRAHWSPASLPAKNFPTCGQGEPFFLFFQKTTKVFASLWFET